MAKLCRVCGEKLHRIKTKTAVVVYSCSKYTKQLAIHLHARHSVKIKNTFKLSSAIGAA